MTGIIFDIKKFAVHDGNGIRTTVFFKGCPLSCVWCHNPEGISFEKELLYIEHQCIGCRECVKECDVNAHCFENNVHILNRELCTLCEKCTESCYKEALRLCGKRMTADEIVNIALEDKDFYDCSGGGVTFSGGECLSQSDFCREILIKLKEHNINCNIDTSGYASRDAIDKVLPYTDMFLYDIKHMDSGIHEKYTSKPNEKILDNLKYIDSSGKETEVRVPLIPGINDDDENLHKTADFLSRLKNLKKVKILAYNNLAGSKYKNLGVENKMPDVLPPTKNEISRAEEIMKSYGISI